MFILEHDILIHKILYYLDIDDIINFKDVDTRIDKILLDKYFWLGYFDKFNLQMPIVNYNDNLINIFKQSKHANDYALECIDRSIGCIYIINISPIDKYLIEYDDIRNRFFKLIDDIKSEYPDVGLSTMDINIMHHEDDDEYLLFYCLKYENKFRSIMSKIKKTNIYEIIYPLIYDDFQTLYR